eukprot:scaffold916_cov516-Prasinococcus_capsulatus_cf.AAC.8
MLRRALFAVRHLRPVEGLPDHPVLSFGFHGTPVRGLAVLLTIVQVDDAHACQLAQRRVAQLRRRGARHGEGPALRIHSAPPAEPPEAGAGTGHASPRACPTRPLLTSGAPPRARLCTGWPRAPQAARAAGVRNQSTAGSSLV